MIKSEYRTPLGVPGGLFLNLDNKKAPCFSQRAEIPRYHLSSPQPHNCGLMDTNIPQRDNGRCPAKPTGISAIRSAWLLQDVFQQLLCTCFHQPQVLLARPAIYFFPSQQLITLYRIFSSVSTFFGNSGHTKHLLRAFQGQVCHLYPANDTGQLLFSPFKIQDIHMGECPSLLDFLLNQKVLIR